MKLLAGKLTPTAGETFFNPHLKIGYFAQYQVEQLNLQESAAAHILNLDPKTPEQKIRTFLGGFGFSGDMAFGKIENFSGGEKARLVLAMLIWQKPNLLLLDEPTNHLDLEMREALAFALQDYTGALVLVAHDRHLLKATVNEFYLVNDHKLTKFSGDLTDYQTWLLDLRKLEDDESTRVVKAAKQQATNNLESCRFAATSRDGVSKEENRDSPLWSLVQTNSAPTSQSLKFKQTQKLEKKLNVLYAAKEKIIALLADATIYQPGRKTELENCLKQNADLENKIRALEEEWLK